MFVVVVVRFLFDFVKISNRFEKLYMVVHVNIQIVVKEDIQFYLFQNKAPRVDKLKPHLLSTRLAKINKAASCATRHADHPDDQRFCCVDDVFEHRQHCWSRALRDAFSCAMM
jgi:hypothetical protein